MARPASVGGGSNKSSCGDVPVLSTQNQHKPLPEEWTLPHEWSIEKREMFQNWKMDIQNQISHLASSLEKSLNSHPHPEIGDDFNYYDRHLTAQFEAQLQQKQREAGNTLIYGLARIQHPQKQ